MRKERSDGTRPIHQHQGRHVAVDLVETDTYGTATLSTKVDYDYQVLGSTSPHTDRIVRLTDTLSYGDTSDTGDERLATVAYTTANTTDWIIAAAKSHRAYDGSTTASPLLARTDRYYDAQSYGTVGTKGLLTKTATKLNDTENAVTLYDYDTYGRIVEVTDSYGDHIVHTDYHGTHGYVSKVTNAGDAIGTGDHVIDIVDYDPGFGVPLEVDDANNNRITANYDDYGRLTEVWLPTEDPASDPATITYSYTIDPTDYPAFVKTSQLTDTTGSGTYLDSWTFYDGFGNVAQTQQPSASDGKHWIVSTGYTDKQGVLRRQAAPFELVLGTAVSGDPGYFDAVWSGASMNIPLHTVYTYDAFGRVTDTETIADDSSPSVLWSTETGYDIVTIEGSRQGLEQTFTDEENAVIEHVTDAHGNLVRVFEYDDTTKITTQYDYDGRNRLVEVIDTDTSKTTMTYDYGGRKESLDDPDMGAWSYTYDVFGNLTSQTDGRSQKLVFAYDEYDRLIAKYDTSISPSNLLAEWDYDASGQLGLLDKSISYESVGGTDYTITVDPQSYDARGRVTETDWNLDGDTYTINWTYDPADRINTITYPTVDGNREIVTYTYDDDNRGLADELTWKEHATATAEDLVTAATWDPLGRPLTQTWGSGTYQFDRVWAYESDTLRFDTIQAGDNANQNDIVNLGYQYYDDGNIQYVTDFRNSSQKQCFEYDDLKRLTTAYTLSGTCSGHTNWDDTVGSGPYRRLYDYENNGNIDQVAGDTGTYQSYTYAATGNAGPHAVTAYDGWSYTYDKNGNVNTRTKTGQPSEDATFNANNQMSAYDVGSDTTEFVYDADGARVMRLDDPNVGSTVTTHYIAGVFEVTNPGTTPDETRSYYTFNGTTVGYRLWTPTSDDRKFLVTDHLGSNAAEVDEATGTVTEQRYLPFGDLRATTSNGLDTDHTYTGQIADESTGLMFYNARYYLPKLRRFISADTIIPDPSNPQDLNRYTYVRNNPTKYEDPSGHYVTCHDDVCQAESWIPGKGFAVAGHDRRIVDADYEYGKNPFTVHGVLEGAGMIPLIGEVFDAANGVLYASEGNWADAGLSMLAVIPVIGDAAGKGGKLLARHGDELLGFADDAAHHGDDVIWALCSFSAETEVVMADGNTRPISQINVGDWVLAADPETGERGTRQVTHLWIHDDVLVDLGINGDIVTTTEDHPFWNATDNQWQPADTLDPGDLLLTATGGLVMVDGIDWTTTRVAAAYNLTIDDLHTYHVATRQGSVLVHNVCDEAWDIAHHAADHLDEIPGVSTLDELATYLDDVMKGPGYAIPDSAGLRTAWWDPHRGVVVIRDLTTAVSPGSVYRPTRGYEYFRDLIEGNL